MWNKFSLVKTVLEIDGSLETHDSKDDSTSIDSGDVVCEPHKNCVFLYIVLHRVVTGEGNQTSKR